MDFKCYVQGCKVTSKRKEDLGRHFLGNAHPGLVFDMLKVAIPLTPKPTPVVHAQSLTTTGKSTKSRSKPPAPSCVQKKRPAKGPSNEEAISDVARHHPLGPDPRNWKFHDGRDDLIELYYARYPITGSIAAEEEELFCVCMQPENGKKMIECANGPDCLMTWFHLDCIGMKEEDVPGEGVDWFCDRCRTNQIGKASNLPTGAIHVTEVGCGEGSKAGGKVKTKCELSIKTSASPLPMSTPSPVNLKPWTADLDKSFVNDPDNQKDFDLTTLERAKESLRTRPVRSATRSRSRSNPTGNLNAHSGQANSWPHARPATGTLGKGNWSKAEEDALSAVVKECVDAGLAGEPMWAAAHPRFLAMGFHRPIGGMKMRWCRGLRLKTKIDERRRKNEAKLLTALQASKKDRSLNAPETGRYRGQGKHGKGNRSAVSKREVQERIDAGGDEMMEDRGLIRQSSDVQDFREVDEKSREDNDMTEAILLLEVGNPDIIRPRAKSF